MDDKGLADRVQFVKKRLRRHQGLEFEVSHIRERRKRLALECDGLRAARCSSGSTSGKSNGFRSSIEELAIRQVDIDERYAAAIAATEDDLIQIKGLIALCDDPFLRSIVCFRYVDCLSWDQIAEKVCYCVQHVHRLHQKALIDIASKM